MIFMQRDLSREHTYVVILRRRCIILCPYALIHKFSLCNGAWVASDDFLKTADTEVYTTHPFEKSPPGCLEEARSFHCALPTHPFETTGGAFLERVRPWTQPSREHNANATHPFETSRTKSVVVGFGSQRKFNSKERHTLLPPPPKLRFVLC